MTYAPWIKRLVAQWLDMAVVVPFLVGYLVARAVLTGTALTVAGIVALVGYSAITYWNRCVTMGRTGWSWGKMLMGIRVVDERTGLPTGIPRAIARECAHTVDMVTVFGIMLPLFPRWDRKGQLFGDKIMHTVVVEQPWNRARSRAAARPENRADAVPAPYAASADPQPMAVTAPA